MMMKKTLLSAILMAAAVVPSMAQTMRVNLGSITYAHSAEQTGHMPFASATTLTIQGKAYNIADITSIVIDNTKVADNTVSVAYDGNSAQVVVAGNVAKYLDVTVNGAHVAVLQDASLTNEITYTLSGTSPAGSFCHVPHFT